MRRLVRIISLLHILPADVLLIIVVVPVVDWNMLLFGYSLWYIAQLDFRCLIFVYFCWSIMRWSFLFWFRAVGLILLQRQATAAECRRDAAAGWLLWLCMMSQTAPCSLCHHYSLPPDTKTQPLSPHSRPPASCSLWHRYCCGNEISKWGQQFCCCQLLVRGVKGGGCHKSNTTKVTGYSSV